MEEEIAKYHKYKNCIVVLAEHRTFSFSVIKNGERIKDTKLKREFIANKDSEGADERRAACFPNKKGYFHYRDDYDDSFYIANVSNFDFISSIDSDKANVFKLGESTSEIQQKEKAMPQLGVYLWRNRNFKYVNKSTIAPQPILKEEMTENKEETEPFRYYEIGQKSAALLEKMKKKLKKKQFALLEGVNLSGDALDHAVNDMFVGPNNGRDIAQNDDFEHLINRWNRGDNPDVHYLKVERKAHFYAERKAPFNDRLCYSAFDVILALNEILSECNDQNVFDENEEDEKEDDIAVILVGSMAQIYGHYVSKFVDVYNADAESKGFGVKYVNEYVKNEGTTNIEDRSSALQQLIQSVVTPEAVSNFKSIADIKNEIIIQMEDTPNAEEVHNEENENTKSAKVEVVKPVKASQPKKSKKSKGKSILAKLLKK